MSFIVMEKELRKLEIDPTLDTPKINFNPNDGILSIEGKSFPPDVATFYERVIIWIGSYILTPNKKTVLSLKLDYFNTASSKIILDILYKFEELHHKGFNVEVKWHYPDDDEDMQETGIEYSEIVDLPFEQIGYTVLFK
jgi:hypothetical protein